MCCYSLETVSTLLILLHTLVKSPSTSPIALFSSFSACLALSRALSATATAPLQFRPPQWRFPSSSRQPAPPQGLSPQGASPGAPQTCWDERTWTCICVETFKCLSRTETCHSSAVLQSQNTIRTHVFSTEFRPANDLFWSVLVCK